MRKKKCLQNICTDNNLVFEQKIILNKREEVYEGREKGGQKEERKGEKRERCRHTLQQKLSSACHLSLFEDVPISCSKEMLEISVLKVE